MKFKKIIGIIIITFLTISVFSNVVKAEDTINTNTSVNTINKKPVVTPSLINNRGEDKNIRNIKVEQKEERKETRTEARQEINQIRNETRNELRASTTLMFKRVKEENMAQIKKMKATVFQIRKEALEKELRIALENIQKVNNQLSIKITDLEQQGKDMTNAKASISLANEKIEKAMTNINLFSSSIFVDTTNVATSTEIDILKPRKLGDSTIQSVKDARDSLKKVIQDIVGSLKIQTNN